MPAPYVNPRDLYASIVQKFTEKSLGYHPQGMRFTAFSSIDAAVPDQQRLPVLINETIIQADDGSFLFMEGYSSVDGGDLVG